MFFPHCVVLYWFLAFSDIPFLDFLVSIFFSGLVKKMSICCWTNGCKKYHFFFWKKPLFSWVLPFFAVDLFFHAWFAKTFCHYSFQMSLKNILFLLAQYLFASVQKKITSKKSWFSLFYVFSPWCYSFYSPRFSFVYFSFFSYHVSSPLCLLSLCSSTLFIMFIYSLSLSLLCFFCLILFL